MECLINKDLLNFLNEVTIERLVIIVLLFVLFKLINKFLGIIEDKNKRIANLIEVTKEYGSITKQTNDRMKDIFYVMNDCKKHTYSHQEEEKVIEEKCKCK